MPQGNRPFSFEGSAAARILPHGNVSNLGFFVSASPSSPVSGKDDLGNTPLVLEYSPLDPRAWSVLLAYRILHVEQLAARQKPLLKSDIAGVKGGILPDVRMLDNSGKLISDDWRHLSRAIEQRFEDDGQHPVLYPAFLQREIDELDEIIDNDLVDGLFSVIYAASRKDDTVLDEHDRDFLHGAQTHAVLRRVFYARLGWLDDILSRRQYLLGDDLTDADLHLFGVLLTFDIGYRSAFPAPDAAVVDYPNLWMYAKRIYTIEGLVNNDESIAIGLSPDDAGVYAEPWGPVAFTETVESITAAWHSPSAGIA